MTEIIYKELSYVVNGLLYKTHKDLGRYRNEKQYGDYFESLLKVAEINYQREFGFTEKVNGVVIRCRVDFLLEHKLVLEFKTKPYLVDADYFQTRRYLATLHLELGILVNFRQEHLVPKRVLNSDMYTKSKI